MEKSNDQVLRSDALRSLHPSARAEIRAPVQHAGCRVVEEYFDASELARRMLDQPRGIGLLGQIGAAKQLRSL
jgi:hypothetical protein